MPKQEFKRVAEHKTIFAGNMGGINGITKPYFPTI
jgi:hypothetical protein